MRYVYIYSDSCKSRSSGLSICLVQKRVLKLPGPRNNHPRTRVLPFSHKEKTHYNVSSPTFWESGHAGHPELCRKFGCCGIQDSNIKSRRHPLTTGKKIGPFEKLTASGIAADTVRVLSKTSYQKKGSPFA